MKFPRHWPPSVRHLVAASSERFSKRASVPRKAPSAARRVRRSWFDGAKDAPLNTATQVEDGTDGCQIARGTGRSRKEGLDEAT